MAATRKKKGASGNTPLYHCRDCAHSYYWHEKGADGKPFLCRCPYQQEGGRFSIFLEDTACEKFRMRE